MKNKILGLIENGIDINLRSNHFLIEEPSIQSGEGFPKQNTKTLMIQKN